MKSDTPFLLCLFDSLIQGNILTKFEKIYRAVFFFRAMTLKLPETIPRMQEIVF